MAMTPTKYLILQAVALYDTLTRALIQQLLDYKNDRNLRKMLQQLVAEGLLHATRMLVVNPKESGPAKAYYSSVAGLQAIADYTNDPSWREKVSRTHCPTWTTLYHFVECARVHIDFDRAAKGREDVRILEWFTERDVANPDENEAHKRFKLYHLFTDLPKKLVCNPDAGLLLAAHDEDGEHRWVAYLELDRHSCAPRQVAGKSKAYAALCESQIHLSHFPAANVVDLRVLSVSYTARRRDDLVKVIRGEPGAELWRFASWEDFASEPARALFAPIWYKCEGEPVPLVISSNNALCERNGVGPKEGRSWTGGGTNV